MIDATRENAVSVDPTKRERIILFGIIPVLAAIVGAIATVAVTKYMGDPKPSDVVIEVLRMANTTPADKLKLLGAVNSSTDRFYTLLGSVVSVVSLVCGVLVWSVADWIRKR